MNEVKNIPRLRFPEFEYEWTTDNLNSISNLNMGQSPNSSSYNEDEIGIPLIQGNADIINRKSKPRQWTTEPTKLCDDGDLIMTVRAPVGYISKSIHNACIGRGVCSIKPKENNSIEFIYQFLLGYEKDWRRLEQGSTFTAVNSNDIKSIKLSFPSLLEQQKIADFLTAVDKRIELLEKKKTLLETYKKGVMKKIFNREIRFKDDIGNDFPDWGDKRLGEVVNLKHGYQFRRTDFTQEGLPIIKIGNVKGTGLFLEDLSFIDENRYEEFKSFEIFNGDILMSLTGNIGRVIEVKNLPYKVIQNYRVGNFQPFDENEISKKFLKHLLETDQVFGRFNSLSNQSAQANFGKQDMDKIKVGIPNLEEQEKISEFLSSIDKQLELLETQIDKSKTWKKGLLQKMFV